MGIGIVGGSIGLLMVLIAYFYPYYIDMKDAKSYYINERYEEAYKCLKGHSLNREMSELSEKVELLFGLEKKYESYLNYTKIDQKLEAFNALIQGIRIADEYAIKAEELGILEDYNVLKNQIEEALESQYGVSVEQAREWLELEDKQLYSRTIYDYLNGTDTLNLQNEDGSPYTKEAEDTPENMSEESEQQENVVISGEEEEFLEETAPIDIEAVAPTEISDNGIIEID